ncbi:MAG: DUF3489 domain-containing protein [Alphaproteobacteria bacterium]|nr:DUF3489 domain-containing protein [Alphaproteobacteria bacterium]
MFAHTATTFSPATSTAKKPPRAARAPRQPKRQDTVAAPIDPVELVAPLGEDAGPTADLPETLVEESCTTTLQPAASPEPEGQGSENLDPTPVASPIGQTGSVAELPVITPGEETVLLADQITQNPEPSPSAVASAESDAPGTDLSTTLSPVALSHDHVIAVCRQVLIDTLTASFGIAQREAEVAAERAVRTLATPPAASIQRGETKLARLITLLGRREGATLAEMITVTGWQAHSVRGVISGTLKKKLGLAVSNEMTGDRGRVYHLPTGG